MPDHFFEAHPREIGRLRPGGLRPLSDVLLSLLASSFGEATARSILEINPAGAPDAAADVPKAAQ